MLQRLPAQVRRRHRRRRDDDPHERDAVCHAAAAGHRAGRAADHELQLRREKHRARARDVSPAAQGVPDLLSLALGAHRARPRPVCAHLHAGRGAHRLHDARAAHLLRGAVFVRHPDRLPDDVRVHRQRAVLDHRGRAAQICAAAAADLSAAGAAARPDDRRVSGRARRGRDRRHVHRHPVCDAVSQGAAQARGRRVMRPRIVLQTWNNNNCKFDEFAV